jgi:YVTN family beta-propeller protein
MKIKVQAISDGNVFKFMRELPRVLIILLFLVVQACDNDPDPAIAAGAEGFFVVNEGGFSKTNASISFFDRETETLENDVFVRKNARPLGDQAQSLTVYEDKAYVVVQNSGKVEVINADDYSSIKTITDDIESPRYFVGASSTKGYLSDWGPDGVTGSVKVIDLVNLKVTKSITTGQGPNKMVLRGNDLYVANSGGFGKDNKVSIIDITTDAVKSTITVGDNPNSLHFDKDGNLWVASSGALAYNDDFSINEANSTKSSLSKITGTTESSRFTFPVVTYGGLGQLEINEAGDKLYYNYNYAVYTISTSAAALPTTPLINKDFYGLSLDPFTGNIIGCEALNFSSPGKIYIYSADGTAVTNIVAGIAPNGIAYK